MQQKANKHFINLQEKSVEFACEILQYYTKKLTSLKKSIKNPNIIKTD